MTIDWWTLALQTINLLILVWLLQRFLYKPVVAAVDRRRARVAAALQEARAAHQAAETERSELEAERAGIDEERHRLLAEAQAEAEESARRRAEKAHAEADRTLAQARAVLSRERDAAERELYDHAAGLAAELARRVLRATVSAPGAEPFMERALAAFEALPQEERERLAEALGEEPVRLVSAEALSDDEIALCRSRLAAALGREVDLEASVDPELVAGLDLRLPHVILACNWRQAIEDARKELEAGDDAR